MVVFQDTSADLALLAIIIAILLYAYSTSQQSTTTAKKRRSSDDSPDQETTKKKRPETKPDPSSSEDNNDDEEINGDKIEELRDTFQDLLDEYRELVDTYDEMTDTLIDELENKLAADAGYWKTHDMDFNWNKYETTIDTLDDLERQGIHLIERFNQTNGWQGTQYESQIKDLIIEFQDLYEQRKEIRDRIENHLKTIYA